MSDNRKDRPDVRHLATAELPQADFPGGRSQAFRIYVAPDAHAQITKHGLEDVSVEICGVLVGRWGRDADGPFVGITNSIRGEAAENKFAEVTFTHATWAAIHQQMDTQFPDKTIVGWYHTHPSFGVFLSERDRFIQEHFFSNPGQVAYVIDPVRKTEGIFIWRNGKTTLSPHYWIGDRIQAAPVDSAESSSENPDAAKSQSVEKQRAETPAEASMFSIATRLLAFVALFLLGYMLARMRTSWEQARLIEGTVAHYGIWNVLRPSLEEAVSALGDDLAAIAKSTAAVSDVRAKSDEGADEQKKRSIELHSRLAHARKVLDVIQSKYCLSTEESRIVESLIVDRMKALRELDARQRTKESAPAEKSDATTNDSAEKNPGKKPSDKRVRAADAQESNEK